jgi:hypothetical protein
MLVACELAKPSVKSLAEKTEVWHGDKEIAKRGLEELSKVKIRYDSILDHNGPSIITSNKFVMERYGDIRRRGCRIRLITDISKDNVSYCKELAKYVELRHLDGIKGNFGIVDGISYGASAKSQEGKFPTEYIYSTVKSFVEQQQYFFEMLWYKAIPVKQRIKEIEQGLKREFIKTIQDPAEIQSLIHKVVDSATEHLDVIFSTAISFYRYEKEGVIQLITQKADNNGINIRIMIKDDDEHGNIENDIIALAKHPHVKVQYLNKSIKTKVITFLADNELALVVELKDENTDIEDDEQAVGLATYSNSESTVLSNASIFETLWLSQSNLPTSV